MDFTASRCGGTKSQPRVLIDSRGKPSRCIAANLFEDGDCLVSLTTIGLSPFLSIDLAVSEQASLLRPARRVYFWKGGGASPRL